jgi:hypothetical protein
VPHVSLDTRSAVYLKLGLEHARMWTGVLDRLRTAGKHAAVLEAMDRLEAETLQAPQGVAAARSGDSD